jgi:very-short-patch-repair endonuclease
MTADQRADALISRQHGAINRRQALAVGLTRHAIEGRVRLGRWLAADFGVYVAATAPDTSERRAAAAVLRGPEGTVASHLTAAALWDLCGFPARPHVTVPRSSSGRAGKIAMHRCPLDADDRGEARGLPVTSAARTLVDCAGLVGYDRLCRLVDRALYLRLTDADGVRAAVDRVAKRAAAAERRRLLRALSVWRPGPHPHSPAEISLARLLEDWGFPPLQRQVVIHDAAGRFVAQVDLAWVDLMVIFEYDGEEFHGPRRRALDAARQRAVEALGWTVVRVTKDDLRDGGTGLRRQLDRLVWPRMAG